MDIAVVNSVIKLSNCYANQDNVPQSNSNVSVYDRIQFIGIFRSNYYLIRKNENTW